MTYRSNLSFCARCWALADPWPPSARHMENPGAPAQLVEAWRELYRRGGAMLAAALDDAMGLTAAAGTAPPWPSPQALAPEG